jgi:hypothetical protein
VYDVVKSGIDEWNPYSLLPHAPSDEFDRESRSIAKKLSKDSSINEIANVVSRVFFGSFEPAGFQKEDCMEVAAKIRGMLQDKLD